MERKVRVNGFARLPAIAEDEDDEIGEALCRELGFDEKWAEQTLWLLFHY